MRVSVSWVARVIACAAAVGWLGVALPASALAQQRAPQGTAQPQAKKEVEAPKAKPFDVCQGMTGATAAEKVTACTQAITEGKLAGGELAAAYLNRGLAESGEGSDARSKADYRAAIRIFNDLILGSPMQPYYYTQRGVIYQTIGEADRAILDFSDAIRLAPRETFPLINRGVILYTKKDNNEGAIADLTAALKLKPCEVAAWANRGIVYRKKGEVDRAITDFNDGIKCLPPRIEPVRSLLAHDAVTSQLTSQQNQQQQDHNRLALMSAFIHFQRGLAFYDKNNYQKAIADFSEAIRLNPLDGSPYIGRGASYSVLQDFKKAIVDFDEALKLAPKQAFTHMQRGMAYHQTGDADRALADYTAAHELTPKDPSPLVNRGIIYYTKKGKFDAAIDDFNEALRLNPKEINALINRGVTYRQKNDPDAAIGDFGKAIDLGLQTASILKLVAKDRDPQTAQLADQVSNAYYQRGMANIDKQNYDMAFADFGRALEISPKEARPHLGRGAALLRQNRVADALKDFDEAIRLAPGLPTVYFERGTAFHRVDDYVHAIADYTESIKLDPKEPLAYINRGMAEIFVNKVDAAIEDFDTALELAPDNVNALIQRGFAYGLLKQYGQAFEDINRALRLTPDNPTALFYLAQIETFRGNTERALEDYAASLRYDAKNPRTYAARATVYMSLGDYESAVDDLVEAVKLRPLDANQFLNRGISYFSIGQYERAVADYTSALKIAPNMFPALNNRCLAKAVLGTDLASARADCLAAQQMNPGDAYTRTNLGVIELKQGDYRKALAEFNAVLAIDPQAARAYYGRGFAKVKLGEQKSGEADIDTAKGMLPNIAGEFASYGVK